MLNGIPGPLQVPMAVAGFRARIALQRPHQELNFQSMIVARGKYQASQAVLASQIDEIIFRIADDENAKRLVYENGALRSLYEDLGATLILLAAASLERLYRAVGVSLLKRGVASYISEISFVEAVLSLANQYKHLGEWQHASARKQHDFDIVTTLVENPLRSDAASEFLKRSGFTTYDAFEQALLTCSDGIVDGWLLPDGRDGIPTISIRAV